MTVARFPTGPRPRGVFVTGTDTGVGKTVVAAVLVRALAADYWKPVQTGAEEDSDTDTVAALTGATVHPPAYVLRAPRSPHEAARREGVAIALDRFVLPASVRPLVVEGAGGVLVPLNDDGALMVDLMARLALPVVVVARSTLGTINHTLLTLAALRGRGLEVAGVVMVGPPDAANREAIEHFGGIAVLTEIPRLRAVDGAAITTLAAAPGLAAAVVAAVVGRR